MATLSASGINPYRSLSQTNTATTAASGDKGSSASQNATEAGSTAGGRVVQDTVTISPQAAALAAALPKCCQQVTGDARAHLDGVYAGLAAKGQSFDFVHARKEDFDGLYGGLDRRSLFAIASNSGGLFSADEQTWAQSIMGDQQAEAMGLTGPMGAVSMAMDPTPGTASGIRFLDSVSEEEKQSMDWKVQRASLQWSYELNFDRHPGEKMEDFSIDDPLVKMLVDGFHSMETQAPRPMVTGLHMKDLEDLKNMPLFDGGYFTKERDAAIADYQSRQAAQAA